MQNILRGLVVSALFLTPALLASADVLADPSSPTEPQPFSFYCDPYTSPFIAGQEYVPDQSTCYYTLPQTAPLKILAIYKGVPGNATLLQQDLTIFSPASSVRTNPNPFGDADQGDDYFAVAYGGFSSGDIAFGNDYLTSNSAPEPAQLSILQWKWGAPPDDPDPVTSPLTVTANDQEITFGDALPSLNATLSGFVNGETLETSDVTGEALCTTDALAQSDAGEYSITCTQGTLASTDYTFDSFVAGVLRVLKALSATDVSCTSPQTYTGSPIEPCSATVTGAGGLNQPLPVSYANNSAVGTAQASASYAGDINHEASADSSTFKIFYRWDGFLQPINDTAHQIGQDLSVFKAGSNVPVKLQLKDASGNIIISSVAPVWLAPQKGAAMNMPVDEAFYTDPATSGNTFELAGDHYQYNWKTKGLASGYWYRIYVLLPDGSIRSVTIGLR